MATLSCCRDHIGHIAQTIKSLEKGLHAFFPHPFPILIQSASSALSAPSNFPPSPNEFAKRPHLEAHSGWTRSSKRPFYKVVWAEKALFRGWRVRWWIGELKKGNTEVLPLLMQRYEIFGPNANAIGKKRTSGTAPLRPGLPVPFRPCPPWGESYARPSFDYFWPTNS